MKTFILYYAIINLITFTTFAVDKYKAQNHRYRIPERTLFTLSLFGGAIGGLLAMHIFRHKTRKPAFVWGMPLLLAVQIVLAWYFMR